MSGERGLCAGLFYETMFWHDSVRQSPPLVLLPGLLSDGRQVRRLARELGRRAVVIDPLGSGRSEVPPDPSAYLLPKLVPRLNAVLDLLGVLQADLVGMSMGGMWAQHALIDDAESRRFRCSLLIGSGAHITPRMRSVMLGLRSMWQHDIPRIDSWRIFQALLFSAEFLDRPSTIPLLELLANDSRTSRQAALCQLDAVLAHDPGEGLAMIHGVRCVLGGQLDVLMPPSTQSELAHALGGVPMEILPGAGHAVWLEQPTALARLMQAALPE